MENWNTFVVDQLQHDALADNNAIYFNNNDIAPGTLYVNVISVVDDKKGLRLMLAGNDMTGFTPRGHVMMGLCQRKTLNVNVGDKIMAFPAEKQALKPLKGVWINVHKDETHVHGCPQELDPPRIKDIFRSYNKDAPLLPFNLGHWYTIGHGIVVTVEAVGPTDSDDRYGLVDQKKTDIHVIPSH